MSSRALTTAVAAALVAATAALAGAVPTLEEALALAFPQATLSREAVFVRQEQLDAAAGLAGAPIESALVTRYRAETRGELSGWAYLDTHRVRTLPETLLIALAPDGAVRRVEVVRFSEPDEYRPRPRWYEQFVGRRLSPELSSGGAIRPVTGATLTARATTEAVRRVLALHAVLGAQAR